MWQRLPRFWTDEEGLATVEYALLLGSLAVAVMCTWTSYGNMVRDRAAQAASLHQPH